MAEPATSGAAGFAGWKLIGGAAGVAAGGAGLAAIVVMLMTPPRSPREWAVGLISTVVCSIGLGSWLLHWLGMSDLAASGPAGLAVLFGLCFACGLPGWALVRAAFTWMIKRDGKDLGEIASDAANTVRDVIKGQ
jgi:hypothetical protein